VIGCLVPLSVVSLTLLARAHLGKAAEFISEVEAPVEQILLLPRIS
jgi:hypothetical protein